MRLAEDDHDIGTIVLTVIMTVLSVDWFTPTAPATSCRPLIRTPLSGPCRPSCRTNPSCRSQAERNHAQNGCTVAHLGEGSFSRSHLDRHFGRCDPACCLGRDIADPLGRLSWRPLFWVTPSSSGSATSAISSASMNFIRSSSDIPVELTRRSDLAPINS